MMARYTNGAFTRKRHTTDIRHVGSRFGIRLAKALWIAAAAFLRTADRSQQFSVNRGNRRKWLGQLDYQTFEPKQLLATVSIVEINERPTLLIDGDNQADHALVETISEGQVKVTLNGETHDFADSLFERIRFLGRLGDDFFENLTDIDSSAIGHGGNDELIGGNGNNWIQGGDGNDRISGGDRNDVLRGRAGNDVIFGGKRHDRIFGDEGNDFLFGEAGDDVISGGSGNDLAIGGNGDDEIDLGSGIDSIEYASNHSSFLVIGGDPFVIRALTGNSGQDTVSNVEIYVFADGNLSSQSVLTATEQVTVRPIMVSNSDGSNTAEFFGNSQQEAAIKLMVDEIFVLAGVDVLWETTQTWNNTFANVGNGGTRPDSDLNLIVNNGDNAGVGSPYSLVIDMYFVEIVPGSGDQPDNVVNGIAFLSNTGVAIHVGDILPGIPQGMLNIARVIAHEISHNLGLIHVDIPGNLMLPSSPGSALTPAQINTIRDSELTRPI